jgi:hypothetical protein
VTVQRLDIIFSALLIVLGGAIIAYALQYGFIRDGVPGAGMFPMVAGVIITVLSIVNLVRQLRGRLVMEGRIAGVEMLPIVGICVLLFAFVYLSRYLGLLLQLPFVLVIMSYLVEPRRGLAWFARITLISVLFTVFSYFFFQQWLGMLFPAGPFGF